VCWTIQKFLERLANALGIPVEELASTRPAAEPNERQNPRRPNPGTGNPGELILTSLPTQPGKTRLQVDKVLSWKLATYIHNLIRQAEEAEISGAQHPEINPDVGKVVGGLDIEENGTG